MAIDGFMEITHNNKPISGETLDAIFGNSKHRACSILSFDIKMQQSSESSRDEEASAPQTGSSEASLWGDGPSASLGQAPSASSGKPNTPLRFSVTKEVDAASSTLFRAYCQHVNLLADDPDRKPFDKVRITVRKSGGRSPLVFLVFEFEEVFVAEYSVNVDDAKVATETLTFKGSTGTMQYRAQKSRGLARPQVAGWSFKKDKTGPINSL
ncbi:MAG: type VI secretion system tube protein Hcp [Gemmataceae bacterium]